MKRITTREELVRLANQLGVRHDWHEPDEQDVTAEVSGACLDNAGFWPGHLYPTLPEDCVELNVKILKDGQPVAAVNLATLLAWASAEEVEPEPEKCGAVVQMDDGDRERMTCTLDRHGMLTPHSNGVREWQVLPGGWVRLRDVLLRRGDERS